jgi:hypothetical protein
VEYRWERARLSGAEMRGLTFRTDLPRLVFSLAHSRLTGYPPASGFAPLTIADRSLPGLACGGRVRRAWGGRPPLGASPCRRYQDHSGRILRDTASHGEPRRRLAGAVEPLTWM